MNCNNVNTLLNRYESVLSAQMTKSLCKSVIYSNIACSVLGIGNQQALTFFASGGGGGLLGPHHQTGSLNSRTLSPRISKISDWGQENNC